MSGNNDSGKYITTKKAKETFGVTEDTLRRWANQGQIPYKEFCIPRKVDKTVVNPRKNLSDRI